MIPEMFKPLLWSYDFSKLDAEQDRKVIIINTINYGSLAHWRWLTSHYGLGAIRELLSRVPATELRPPARRLASLLFSIKQFNDTPRGTH